MNDENTARFVYSLAPDALVVVTCPRSILPKDVQEIEALLECVTNTLRRIANANAARDDDGPAT